MNNLIKVLKANFFAHAPLFVFLIPAVGVSQHPNTLGIFNLKGGKR